MEFSSQPGALGRAWRPATDNRPFFYETAADRASLTRLLLVTFLLLGGLHLWHYARQRVAHDTAAGSTAWLPFFAMTGCAALGAQVALLQRYMLVVGSPTLTLVALLFPLLFFGGLGSLASTALSDHMLQRLLPATCVALGVVLVLYLAAFPAIRAVLEPQHLPLRLLSTMVLLAPLGTLMGLPFPVALRLLAPVAQSTTPWVWGVSAAACVLGSVAAISLAVLWGLQAVVLLGALLYLLAGYWSRRLLVQQRQPIGITPVTHTGGV
jgi:hypothetical protein